MAQECTPGMRPGKARRQRVPPLKLPPDRPRSLRAGGARRTAAC